MTGLRLGTCSIAGSAVAAPPRAARARVSPMSAEAQGSAQCGQGATREAQLRKGRAGFAAGTLYGGVQQSWRTLTSHKPQCAKPHTEPNGSTVEHRGSPQAAPHKNTVPSPLGGGPSDPSCPGPLSSCPAPGPAQGTAALRQPQGQTVGARKHNIFSHGGHLQETSGERLRFSSRPLEDTKSAPGPHVTTRSEVGRELPASCQKATGGTQGIIYQLNYGIENNRRLFSFLASRLENVKKLYYYNCKKCHSKIWQQGVYFMYCETEYI